MEKNGKIELVSCLPNKNSITIYLKKEDKVYKGKSHDKSTQIAISKAVKKAIGIEGMVKNFNIRFFENDLKATLKAIFKNYDHEIVGEAKSAKIGDPIVLLAKAYINAYNQTCNN